MKLSSIHILFIIILVLSIVMITSSGCMSSYARRVMGNREGLESGDTPALSNAAINEKLKTIAMKYATDPAAQKAMIKLVMANQQINQTGNLDTDILTPLSEAIPYANSAITDVLVLKNGGTI